MKKVIIALVLLLSSPSLFAGSNLELMGKWIGLAITTFSGQYPLSAASTVAIKVVYVGPIDQVNVIFVMGDKTSKTYTCTEHMKDMEGFPHCMEPMN